MCRQQRAKWFLDWRRPAQGSTRVNKSDIINHPSCLSIAGSNSWMEGPMERWGLDMQVNSRIIAAVIAYLLAGFSAVLLFRRGFNWRFKFLVAVVGLMPFYEAVRLLARYHLWHTPISEIGERRVGKEWRSRWSPYHLKKKKTNKKRQTRR